MAKIEQEIFLVNPLRTPIGRFGGSLASLTAADLGAEVSRAVIAKSGVSPEKIDEVIFGNARQAGVGPNVARQVAVRSGLPHETPAWTVNQACGSGMRTIINAADQIRLGNASLVLAGGTESMSNTPYLLLNARWGMRMGDQEVVDGMVRDGFMCPLADEMMGATAETLADQYEISREEQDEFAARSQERAARAWDEAAFSNEIVPVEVKGRKGSTIVDRDEHPRPGTTIDKLAKLPPVFRTENGTVHAGNSSGVTDGAAAMLVASAAAVEDLGLEPVAKLVAYSQSGVDPKIMGIGPVPATRAILEETGMSLDDIDLIELNEAFAAQVIACDRELDLDPEKLNVNGGAIALGHPIGCTGARITTTLLHAMDRRKADRGLATLCISGGMGLALLVERC